MKTYLIWWLVISFLVALEYLLAVASPESSLFHQTVALGPGRSLSLWLGYGGFAALLVMNAYSLKKRVRAFSDIGPSLQAWFNFHVFCGLLGPTLILFHSNLKVRGLVAVAFWSMLISLVSGLIGRYLYAQLSVNRQGLTSRAEHLQARFETVLQAYTDTPGEAARLSTQALFLGGATPRRARFSFWGSVLDSVRGDLWLLFGFKSRYVSLDWRSRVFLREFVLARRRLALLEPMRRLLAYWRAFHLPFAFFMYAAAVIHVITTTLFHSME